MTQNRDGGYLLIDHQASPGIPEHLAIAAGMDPKLVAEGKRLEAATLTCSHCKCSVMKNPLRQRERENCPKCNFHYICDLCAARMREPDYVHTPHERYQDIVLNQALGSPSKLILP